MTRYLYIGDPHVTSTELPECRVLAKLVLDTMEAEEAEKAVWVGDQHNNHDTMSVRVMDFWNHVFRTIPSIAIVGNHDQEYPGSPRHAMMAHDRLVDVVEGPRSIAPNTWAIPYYHDEDVFVESLKQIPDSTHTLVCHATFDGSMYENGFYAKEALSIAHVSRFRHVISGHIHTPQSFANISYIGAPRWRTRSDANIDRYLYLIEHTPTETKVLKKIETSGLRRIWVFDDTPDAPWEPGTGVDLTKDAVHVDVYGPPSYVTERVSYLRAQGVRPRSFPDRARARKIKESAGISHAFQTFAESFRPKRGTSTKRLLEHARARLA